MIILASGGAFGRVTKAQIDGVDTDVDVEITPYNVYLEDKNLPLNRNFTFSLIGYNIAGQPIKRDWYIAVEVQRNVINPVGQPATVKEYSL